MNWSRIERWSWYAFLVTASWQTRSILWHAGTTFSEWRSAAFWLSDAFIVLLVVLAVIRGWRIRNLDRVDRALIVFVAAASLSLVVAVDRRLSLVALARLAEFAVFFLYVRHWAVRHFNADSSVLAFVVGALAQAGLGIAQFILQRDVGIRAVGETLLRTDMHGVAVFYSATGEKILRAYGTLPHPNVLAAWLFVALAGIVWLYVRHGARDPLHRVIWAGAGTVLLWGMFLTFSRTVIAVSAVAAVVVAAAAFSDRFSAEWANIAVIRKRLMHIGIVVITVVVAFAALYWPLVSARGTIHGSDEAVQLRIDYARDALATGRGWHINWTGVGIGGFVPWLMRHAPSQPDYLYQPAHSLPLLVYAETGVIGIAVLVVFIILITLQAWRSHRGQPMLRIGVLALAGALVLISLTDHFFWTLQQGRILWWLVLALAVG